MSCYGETFNQFKEVLTAGKRVLGIDEEYKPLYTKGERANMTIANIVIAKISVRENDDGRIFTRLHHIESIENARIRRLKEIHLKLACDDTQALEDFKCDKRK